MLLNNNQLFLIGADTVSPFPLHFTKITIENTSSDWSNKILCSFGVCNPNLGESIMSKDKSTIYSFFVFGNTTYLYFANFNITNGSLIGSRYKSSVSWSEVDGIALNGNFLIASSMCSSASLIVFDVSLLNFKAYTFVEANLFDWAVEVTSGR